VAGSPRPCGCETVIKPGRAACRGAVLVGADAFFNSRRDQIIGLVAHLRLPAIYEVREFVAAGGLMSYGTSLADAYRQLGVYAGRIRKGVKSTKTPTAADAIMTSSAVGVRIARIGLGRRH